MNWKNVLMPDLTKLVTFLLLVVVVGIILQNSMISGNISENHYLTAPYPLVIGHTSGTIVHKTVVCDVPIAPKAGCIPESSFSIDYLGLAINMMFWYLISCALVLGYGGVKKR